MSGVELGFLEKCEEWRLESRLFPCKVGGKPAWLDLEKLPSPSQLECQTCKKPMVFLCQVYAEYETDPKNFHRTIYVFLCKTPTCSVRNNASNLKIFRNSLPRDNKFYDHDPPKEEPDEDFKIDKFVKLCRVCGCLGEKSCAKCKKVNYCSREHQVPDWKLRHQVECSETKNVYTFGDLNILYPEFVLVTEPEEPEEDETPDLAEEMKKYKKLAAEGKTGTMSDVKAAELESHATGDVDKTFTRFRKKLRAHPDQVLRYERGGQPLWIAESPTPADVPNCEYCGGVRQFEFQIMPQMLTMLKEHNLDWGVVAVYTCKNSCTDGEPYKNEFVYKQDVSLSSINLG